MTAAGILYRATNCDDGLSIIVEIPAKTSGANTAGIVVLSQHRSPPLRPSKNSRADEAT
jgi:hypothetical protein